MKKFKTILGSIVIGALLSSCAENVCPANAREYQHRQLTNINKKRKRDIGLFPKAMHPSKRKVPKNSTQNIP